MTGKETKTVIISLCEVVSKWNPADSPLIVKLKTMRFHSGNPHKNNKESPLCQVSFRE